jgi:hypothetical protein
MILVSPIFPSFCQVNLFLFSLFYVILYFFLCFFLYLLLIIISWLFNDDFSGLVYITTYEQTVSEKTPCTDWTGTGRKLSRLTVFYYNQRMHYYTSTFIQCLSLKCVKHLKYLRKNHSYMFRDLVWIRIQTSVWRDRRTASDTRDKIDVSRPGL